MQCRYKQQCQSNACQIVQNIVLKTSMSTLKRKNCSTYLNFQQTQPMEKKLAHDIPGKPWKAIGTNMFTLNNTNYLCIADYHNKFLIVKRTQGLMVDDYIRSFKVLFA